MLKIYQSIFLAGLYLAAILFPCISASAAQYVTAINIKGDDAADTQSSGLLPGTSPSAIHMLRSSSGRPVPLWRDKVFSPLPASLLQQTRRLLEQKRLHKKDRRKAYGIGDQQTFWVMDDLDSDWRQVTATAKKTGVHSYIFVDNTVTVPDVSLELYVTEFETMYSVLADNIGAFTDRDNNGKVAILLYNINDGGTAYTGYYGGYFWGKDYYADSYTQQYDGIRSNEMDVIYIRGKSPNGWTAEFGDFFTYNLTTLVHEYQHLVHFGLLVWSRDVNADSSDVWIDEMMAMASETMYFKKKLEGNPSFVHDDMLPGGYLSSRIDYYNQDPSNSIRNGHGLTYWDNAGDVFANYTLAYLFGQYLASQSASGQGIFKKIIDRMTSSGIVNYLSVAGVAAQEITGIGSWEDLLKSWAMANMLNQSSGSYGYKGAFSVTAHGPTAGIADIHSSGIVYRMLDGGWSPPSDAGADIRFTLFDAGGQVAATTTTTADAGVTTSTESTSTSTISGSVTTTTIDGACTNPAFPHDCMDINGGCCPFDSPICCAEGCCPDDYPLCGADGLCHNTPQIAPTLCPFSMLLGEKSPELIPFYRLRDTVLTDSPDGRRRIALFYVHAPEITSILRNHHDLQIKAYELILGIIPAAKGLIFSRKAVIQQKDADRILCFLDALSKQGSTPLKKTCADLKHEIQEGTVLKSLNISIE